MLVQCAGRGNRIRTDEAISCRTYSAIPSGIARGKFLSRESGNAGAGGSQTPKLSESIRDNRGLPDGGAAAYTGRCKSTGKLLITIYELIGRTDRDAIGARRTQAPRKKVGYHRRRFRDSCEIGYEWCADGHPGARVICIDNAVGYSRAKTTIKNSRTNSAQ